MNNTPTTIAPLTTGRITPIGGGATRAFINTHREPVEVTLDEKGVVVVTPPEAAQYVRELNADEIAALEAPTE